MCLRHRKALYLGLKKGILLVLKWVFDLGEKWDYSLEQQRV